MTQTDFLNLRTEYSLYETHNTTSQSTLTAFGEFFNDIHKALSSYYAINHSALESMFSTLVKTSSQTSYTKIIFDFYRLF